MEHMVSFLGTPKMAVVPCGVPVKAKKQGYPQEKHMILEMLSVIPGLGRST